MKINVQFANGNIQIETGLQDVLTDRPLRKRFFLSDEPHLAYQDGEVEVVEILFVMNTSEFAGLRTFFGDGGFVKVGADDAISCVTDW